MSNRIKVSKIKGLPGLATVSLVALIFSFVILTTSSFQDSLFKVLFPNSKSNALEIAVNYSSPPLFRIMTVQVAATKNSASVSWYTSFFATSMVKYGQSSKSLNLLSTVNESLIKTHLVNIYKLKSDTLYYYKVYSQSSSGIDYVSPVMNFRTTR